MAVYSAYTVMTVPGKRFDGVEHMKKLKTWLKDKYEVPSEVLGNLAGSAYEHHIVLRFENLGQLEEITSAMMADPEYLQWFSEAEGLVDWKTARQSLYQIY